MSNESPMEWTWIDKSKWGEGSWQHEPDKTQWTDEATGLPCLALRHPTSGHWCGYVGVSPTHPLHGRDYDCGEGFEVHGGITFAAGCEKDDAERGICHIPAPGEPDDVWWFGFDCAHGGDRIPAYRRYPGSDSGTYRDLAYVKREAAGLASQLAAVRS